MAGFFIKLMQSRETEELLRDPNTFTLLSLIAYRARRNDSFSVHGLKPGEALIGDHAACGLTEQKYRTAKNKLKAWGIVTFHATNKGTIAKIVNASIYDIYFEKGNGQSNSPATDQQRLTERIENKKDKSFLSDSVEIGLAKKLFTMMLSNDPKAKQPDFQKWAKHIGLLIRRDNRSPEDIEKVIEWSQEDAFWQNNILSTQKLREQFDQLYLKARQKQKAGSTQAGNYEEIFRGGI